MLQAVAPSGEISQRFLSTFSPLVGFVVDPVGHILTKRNELKPTPQNTLKISSQCLFREKQVKKLADSCSFLPVGPTLAILPTSLQMPAFKKSVCDRSVAAIDTCSAFKRSRTNGYNIGNVSDAFLQATVIVKLISKQ